jgi:DNA-binding transcriptional MerR regulator
VRISELSARSGVAVGTIKFYVREQLLPGGEKTSATQTNYGEPQLSRLRLIRALVEVGGLSIANVRHVLTAIDDEELPVGYAIGAAAHSLPATARPDADDEPTAGERAIEDLLTRRGWHVSPDNAGRALAARVLDDYLDLARPDLLAPLEVYAEAAERVAEADLETVAAAATRSAMAETVIVGTVLGDALFAGLRRMAHENASVRLFPTPAPTPAPAPDLGQDTRS